MSKRKDVEKEMRQKLDSLEAEIERLRMQIDTVEAERAAEQHRRIQALLELKAKARSKFAEMLDASEEAWEEVQSGLEHYWSAVGNEMKSYEDFFDRKKD